MRTNRIRTTVLAATALVAALSLTACSGDDGSGSDNGKAGAAAPAANTTARHSASPSAAPQKDGTDADADARTDSGAKAPAATTAPPAKTKTKPKPAPAALKTPVTCVGENTKVTVTKVSRPVNHLLLTLTNTGSRPCYAYHAPKLRFDEAQAVFQVLDESRPQAVVTLDPGQSAYAAIGLTGEPGGKTYKGTHLAVHFSARDNSSTNTAPAELTLPAGTYWSDSGYVTYWQSEMGDALVY